MPDYDALTASPSDSDSGEDVDDPDLGGKSHNELPKYSIDGEQDHDPVSPSAWRNYFEAHLPGKEDRKSSRRNDGGFVWTLREIFGYSWLYVLLVFVPFGIAAHVAGLKNPTVTFALNALAIVPLTGLLTYATENVAHNMGNGLGALLNITFGNLVEMVILFMLREGHLRIVIASLLGSVFVNLLFILGIAIMSAGLRHPEAKYDQRVTQILVFFMTTGVLSLLIPTSLHACVQRLKQADTVTLKFSRGISITLLLLYATFVHFQIRSSSTYKKMDEMTPIEELELGKAAPPVYTESSNSRRDSAYSVRMTVLPTGQIGSARIRRSKSSTHSEKRRITNTASITLLIISAGIVSLCADYMVDAIEHVVADAPITEAFLGLIILPLLGNAAELATAVTVAVKNQIDLAINVTVGSAIQITLFMAPFMVLLGWATGKELSLYFDMFQVVALLATLMIVSGMMLSGRSNYLLGVLLCACYVVIGTGAFFLPNQHGKSKD